MTDTESSGETATDLMKVALNTLYLSLESAVRHIETTQSAEDVARFKADLLERVKDGRIDMALLEDAALYDFVVPKLEQLLFEEPVPQ